MDIYGIRTCDTCRKALKWLAEAGYEAHWHDLREDGIDRTKLERWLAAHGPEGLVNRRSATWRGLGESERERAMDPARAAELLVEHPTLVKRPVIELKGRILVGFNATVRDAL